MKTLLLLLILLIVGCANQNALFKDVEKTVQIKCNILYDTLNTFENSYSCNTPETVKERIPFYLSQEEQRRIIKVINESEYFELPDTINRFNFNPDENGLLEIRADASDLFCIIELDGKKKSVYSSRVNNIESEDYLRFESVMKVISEIAWGREEIKKITRGKIIY